MKKLIGLLYFVFVVNVCFSQLQWVQQTSPTSVNFTTVSFINPNNGIISGVSGTMLLTVDGGANWTIQSTPTSEILVECQFVSSNAAYVIGNNGVGLKSADAGVTWTVMNTGTNSDLRGIYFHDDNNGYYGGQSQQIGKTVNGGSNWGILDYGAYWLRGFDFTSIDTGYVVGDGGNIWKTVDAGSSWSSQTSPIVENFWRVFFPAKDTGFAVGNNGTAIKTVNGGIAWSTLNTGVTVTLRELYFFNTNEGYVVGDAGTILHTIDGGQNWIQEPSGTLENLAGITFLNPSLGYIIGNNGTILKTACASPVAGFTADTSNGTSVQFNDTSSSASSWSWDFGDFQSSSLQNPVHIYVTTGWYYVCLTITDSCGSDTICDSIYVSESVGIGQLANSDGQFTIYPNPTAGKFQIQSSQAQRVEVYDLFGRQVYQQQVPIAIGTSNQQQVDMRGFAKGMYVYVVKGEGEMVIGRGKVIIE